MVRIRVGLRRGVFLLVTLFLLAGLLAQPVPPRQEDSPVVEAVSVETPMPPQASPVLLLPRGLSIAGLPISGLTIEQARAALEQYRLKPLRQSLRLRIGEKIIALDPARVGLGVDVEPALAQALEDARLDLLQRWPICLGPACHEVVRPSFKDLPIQIHLDEAALRQLVEDLALAYGRPPLPLRPAVLANTEPVEAQGVLYLAWSPKEPAIAFQAPVPGCRLDVTATLSLLASAVVRWDRPEVSLPLEEVAPPAPDLGVLAEVLRRQSAAMPGVVGIYLQDLDSGREVGVHDQVVFSGASVMKIAILLLAYQALDTAPKGRVAQDLKAMVVYSDNGAANRLLQLGGGGNDARGAQRMTEMLRQLGLANSFLCHRYGGGPRWRGCPPEEHSLAATGSEEPVTEADKVLQTTPRDMGLLLAHIYECSQGEGPILESFPGKITSAECQAMLQLMRGNADPERLVAGLPAGIPVAHKSGWIDDMKADAGIIFSPGGTYVLSIFTWEKGVLTDEEGNPRIASLSWIVFSFFNPL